MTRNLWNCRVKKIHLGTSLKNLGANRSDTIDHLNTELSLRYRLDYLVQKNFWLQGVHDDLMIRMMMQKIEKIFVLTLLSSYFCDIIISRELTSHLSIQAENILRLKSVHIWKCTDLTERDFLQNCSTTEGPVVFGKCCINCKCKAFVKPWEDGFEKAWDNICRTRDACDSALEGMLCISSFNRSNHILGARIYSG